MFVKFVFKVILQLEVGAKNVIMLQNVKLAKVLTQVFVHHVMMVISYKMEIVFLVQQITVKYAQMELINVKNLKLQLIKLLSPLLKEKLYQPYATQDVRLVRQQIQINASPVLLDIHFKVEIVFLVNLLVKPARVGIKLHVFHATAMLS